jgi:hypothetical protein
MANPATISASSTSPASGTVSSGSSLVITTTFAGSPSGSVGSITTNATKATLTLQDSGTGTLYVATATGNGSSTLTFTFSPTTSTVHSTGTLTIVGFNPGGTTVKVNGSTSSFDTTHFSNGNAGLTSDAIACFTRGTQIATPGGERPIETLRIGDLVLNAGGSARSVKWVGKAEYEAEALADPAIMSFARPVLFRAGALGEGLPVRDLAVSPMHGMLIDGALIPAAALVNGESILRSTPADGVEYYHVELDSHDMIVAAGVVSESFIDRNSRAMFDNAAEFDALYGEQPAVDDCAERIEDGYFVQAVRDRLAALAGLPAPADAAPGHLDSNVERIENGFVEGWAVDRASPLRPVEIDISVDGVLVARGLANRYRTDLEMAGLGDGRCGFRIAVPENVGSLSNLSVRRTADGAELHMNTAESVAAE